jgi:hypothetical protein
VSRTNGAYEIGLTDGSDPSGAIREIVAAIPTARVELHRPTLEDVFIRIVQGSAEASSDDVERLRSSLRSEAPAEVEP